MFFYNMARGFHPRRRIAYAVFFMLVFVFLIPSRHAVAYRPFISTDAAVVDRDELEIELGLFSISHEEGKDEITVPSLVLNYGILKNWEVVGEFGIQVYREGEDRNTELKEPALLLKGVLREGLLQNQQGPSLAVEFGVLLPSTVKGERSAGLEGIGIFSGKIRKLAYHLNFGGELDREDFDLNGIWGIILEYPFEGKLRLVGEINGVFKRNELPENLGLIGFIWEVRGVALDSGLRVGLTEAAPDWELTAGITFSF